MQYQEAVAEARTLVKRSEQDQWRLADLTWEQVKAGKSRAQWANDIGVSVTHSQNLARLGERWEPTPGVDRPPFSEAYAAVRNPGYVEQGRAQGEARATIRSMPPEQKAEVAREIVQDLPTEHRAAIIREAITEPKTADSVMRDTHSRRQITDARERIVSEIEGAARDRTDADPQSRAIREASLTINIESNISKARFWLAEATRQLQDLEDRDPTVMERLARDVDEVDLALGWLRSALEGGRVSDEDLARLLDGGA